MEIVEYWKWCGVVRELWVWLLDLTVMWLVGDCGGGCFGGEVVDGIWKGAVVYSLRTSAARKMTDNSSS